MIVQLADEAALARYLDHPVRKRYPAEHLELIEDERIEIDVPVDLALEREALTSWYWGIGVAWAHCRTTDARGPCMDDLEADRG